MTTIKTGIRTTLIRELRRMGSRPLYLFISLILPLVSFVFFASLFKDGTLRELPVAVVDMDMSAQSRQVLRHIETSPAVKLQKVESANKGRKLLENGEVFGLLLLPKNFQADLMAGKSPDVVLYYSNLNLSVGSTVNTNIRSVVMTIAAGANLQKRMLKGQMRSQALSQMQPIRVDTHVLANPTNNYSVFLASALLPIMLQMFIIVTIIYAIGLELKESTAENWLKLAGGDILKAIVGKMLPYTVIFIVLGLLVNSVLFDYLHVPMNGSRLLTDGSLILMVLAYEAIALSLIIFTANLRLSVSIGAGYGAMAFSFSGLAFPVDAMPAFFQYFSRIFPFRFYLESFVDQAYRAVPLHVTSWRLLAMCIFLCLPFLAFKRAKKVVSDPIYWGKL